MTEERKQEVANLAHDFFHLNREERLIFFDALGTLANLTSGEKLECKIRETFEDSRAESAWEEPDACPFAIDAFNEIKEGLMK